MGSPGAGVGRCGKSCSRAQLAYQLSGDDARTDCSAPAQPIRLPDPRDAYRKRLADLQEQTGEKELSPENRWLQAEALYHTGQYEAALVGFEGLLKSGAAGKEEDCELYRLLTLARLKRTKESKQALADWLPKLRKNRSSAIWLRM